jgi:hypothetical protein
MKNLSLILLLTLFVTKIYGQDVAIEISGHQTWEQTNFKISIEQKGASATIKYKINKDVNRDSLKKNSEIQALTLKYKDVPKNPEMEKKFIEEFSKILPQLRKTYQDSLTIDIEQYSKYKKLLNYITTADKAMFDGGVNRTSDQDFLYCTITHNNKVTSLRKNAPLAVTSPLLYALIRETLILGEEAKLTAVFKIDELFKYLL